MRREPQSRPYHSLLLHGWMRSGRQFLNGKEVNIVGTPSGLYGKEYHHLNGKPKQIGTPSGLKEQYMTGKQIHAIGISDRPASSVMDDNSGK